jgi:hypothetical protein
MRPALIVCCLVASASCASQSGQLTVAQARDKLRAGLSTPIHTRDERDDQSRMLVDAVEQAQLERMTFSEVQATFGLGNVCQANDLCAAKGFSGDDVYYVMGRAADAKIKLLPTLIFGFDPHGHVKRVYTLQTH